MTLAVEIPFYDTKLGGFNVEDVVYITGRGVDVLSSSLSKKLNIRS
jgi:Xaa-Pro aminopeptidase